MFYTPTTLLQRSQDEDAAKAASTSHRLLDFPGILPNIRNAGKEIFKMPLGQKGNQTPPYTQKTPPNKPSKNQAKTQTKNQTSKKPKQTKNKPHPHELASPTRSYILKIYKHLIQTERD